MYILDKQFNNELYPSKLRISLSYPCWPLNSWTSSLSLSSILIRGSITLAHHSLQKGKKSCWLPVTLVLIMWLRSLSTYETFGKIHKVSSVQSSHLHEKIKKLHLSNSTIMKLIWLLFRSVFVWYKNCAMCLLNAVTNPSLIVQEPELHNSFTFFL